MIFHEFVPGLRPGICVECGEWRSYVFHNPTLSQTLMPDQTPTPATPTVQQSVAAVAAAAATSPPGHHSISIWERLWSYISRATLPVVEGEVSTELQKDASTRAPVQQ